MRNVIIPVEVINKEEYINLCDVTHEDLIIAYNGNKAIGFITYADSEWSIQKSAHYEDHGEWYNTLTELVRFESKKYFDFNLKVL